MAKTREDFKSRRRTERRERSFRRRAAETATRGDREQRRARRRARDRAPLVVVRESGYRRSLSSRKALSPRKERGNRFSHRSRKKRCATLNRRTKAQRQSARFENRSVENVRPSNPISLLFFCVVSSAQISRRRGLTSHTKSNIRSCFFSSEAQPRNARDLRLRALALRRCCAFSAGWRGHNFTRLAVRAP